MLSDIDGIRLTGGIFKSQTELSFFNDGKSSDAIIYGRNGTGKSTVVKAVKSIADGSNSATIQEAYFLDKDKKIVVLSEEEKKHIFVFNEEFIDKNVRLRTNGLDTIVMLGKHIDLEDQISEETSRKGKLEHERDAQQEIVKKYGDEKEKDSPAYCLKKVKERLQGDLNWAGRTKDIRGNRQNASVNEEVYKRIIHIQPSDSKDGLEAKYASEKKELTKLRRYAGNQTIDNEVLPCQVEYNESRIRELLARKIERPELSERERKLVELGTDELEKRQSILEKNDTTECPFCLRPFSNDYKEQLVRSIENALQQKANRHRKELSQCLTKEVQLDLEPYENLLSVKKCEKLCKKLNMAIRSNNDKIRQKYKDPYTPITEDIESVDALCNELNADLNNLEKERQDFNRHETAIKELQNDLVKFNDEIAYYEIKDLADRYEEQVKAQQNAEKELEKIENDLGECSKKLEALKAQQKDVTLAQDVINRYLSYIFFDKRRLRIEFKNDAYILLVNGYPVRPSEVSSGERNIIALCYYFANIMQEQNSEESLKEEYLLVIDDPISSIDRENCIGIMSFLNFQIRQFLNGNLKTRFIIFTHNLQVCYNMRVMLKELCNSSEKTKGRKFYEAELMNRNFVEMEKNPQNLNKTRNEYSTLMSVIYDYAVGKEYIKQSYVYELAIGNIMRQVLEAFSTFLYKKGITGFFSEQEVLSTLKNEHVEFYFARLMYGLILNEESHTKNKIKFMQNMEFQPTYSAEEKQKIAKSILCLIYLLVPDHLRAHLAEEKDLEENITKWRAELREEDPFTQENTFQH